MERSEIESAVRHAYEHRAANDPEGAGQIFAPDATYRVAGHKDFCSAVTICSGSELQPALRQLFQTFRATKFEVIPMIIGDDRAAALVRADFRFAPTDTDISTELAHFWTFKNGKATELIEFFDSPCCEFGRQGGFLRGSAVNRPLR